MSFMFRSFNDAPNESDAAFSLAATPAGTSRTNDESWPMYEIRRDDSGAHVANGSVADGTNGAAVGEQVQVADHLGYPEHV